MTPHTTRSRPRELLRGVSGLLALIIVMFGVPMALAALAGWPLPRQLPSLAEISSVLSSRTELPAATVLKAVALVGWVAWMEIALAVVADVAARARQRSAPALRLPMGGAAQALAGRLVTSAMLLASPLLGRTDVAPPPRPLAAVTAVAFSPAPTAHPTPPPEELSPGTKSYTVRPGDYLSRIAKDHLGNGRGYPEISALNRGRIQPDGDALVDDDLIRPNWRLVMPPDASGVDVIVPLPPAPDASAAVPPPAAPEALAPAPLPSVAPQLEPLPEPGPAPTEPPACAHPAPEEALPAPPTPTTPPAPTSPAAPTTPPASTSPAAPTTPPTPAGDRNGEVASPVPVRGFRFAAPALLAGLAVSHLARLRAGQQRRRRRGRDIPRPAPPLQEAETVIRAVADEDAAAWVDGAIRYLWTAFEAAQPPEIPGVCAVRVGRFGVEFLLDRPVEAPHGFISVDEGRVWRLDPALDLAALLQLADGQSAALPALLSVGETPEGPLLVDLETAGTLAVEGDAKRVAGFLAGAAVELASAPWADDVPVVLVGGDQALTRLEGVELIDAEEAMTRFPTTADETHDEPPSRLAARVAPPACDALAPTAIVAAPGTEASVITTLAAVARPQSGVVLVAPGPFPEAGLRLRIESDGTARLEPAGIDLTSAVDEEAVAAIGALLAQATDTEDVALVVEPPDVPTGEETPEPERWVRVLGPIEIDWARTPPRPRSAEVIVYLATRNRPVPADRLRVALWPDPKDGEVASTTVRSTISRARGALGKDAEGHDYLPDAKGGCLQLRPSIGCDWRHFRQLVARAHAAPSGEAIEHYRAALALVRGAPFADPPKGCYGWAASLAWEIETAVADVAERMAELCLDAGESKLANWAVRRGLLVSPAREALHQLRMRASAAEGDRDGIERAWQEVRLALRSNIGPLEEPREDTIALYETLTGREPIRTSRADAARLSGRSDVRATRST